MQEVVGNEAAVSSAPARATSYLLESGGILPFNRAACHFPLHQILSHLITNFSTFSIISSINTRSALCQDI